MLHPSRIFFYGCVALIGGVLLRSYVHTPDTPLLGILAVSVAFFGISLFRKPFAVYALAAATFALGMAWFGDASRAWEHQRDIFLALAGKNITRLEATVADRHRARHATIYTLTHVSLSSGAAWSLLYTGSEGFLIGDRISIEKSVFDTSTATESFLKRDNIAGSLLFPKSVVLLGKTCSGAWDSARCFRHQLYETLAKTRESFEHNLRLALPEPHVSLAAGLLLGARAGIPEDLKEEFRRTGLSHIVAVSGYNVTIVVLAVSTLLGLLLVSRRAAFWIASAFVVLFALVTGATASVIRASVMGFLVILAQKESRLYSARVAIAFAGAAMLIQNPLVLRYDLGFALSFLATIGLLTLFPLLQERAHRLPSLGGMKDVALQTVSAQLFVLPLLIVVFGSVSTVFLISNIAVLPVIPPVMLFSFLGGVAGFANQAFATVVSFPAHALISYQLGAITLLARVPHSLLEIDSVMLRWGFGALAAAGVVALLWLLARKARLS